MLPLGCHGRGSEKMPPKICTAALPHSPTRVPTLDLLTVSRIVPDAEHVLSKCVLVNEGKKWYMYWWIVTNILLKALQTTPHTILCVKSHMRNLKYKAGKNLDSPKQWVWFFLSDRILKQVRLFFYRSFQKAQSQTQSSFTAAWISHMICIWFRVALIFCWGFFLSRFSNFCCYSILLVRGSLRYFVEWVGKCEHISVEMIWGHDTYPSWSSCWSRAPIVPRFLPSVKV